MADTLPRPRPAHAPGPTYLAYTRNGQRLVTAGTNDSLRIFETGSDDEPVTIFPACEGNFAVVATNDFFVTGSEDGSVCKFSLDSNALDQVLVRCTLPIRHLALSPNGEWLAVASDELVVKVVNTNDMDRVLYLREQQKAVKNVSFDPSGLILSVCCSDGVIYFYDMQSEQPEVMRKVDGLIRAVETEDEASIEVAWHPDGRAFAVPTSTRDVQVMSQRDWANQRAFKGGHSNDITALSWSPNGALLATAGRDERVCLWDTRTQKMIQSLREGCGTVLAFSWHPTENILSYTNNDGQLFIHVDFVEKQHTSLLEKELQPAPFIHDPLGEISGNACKANGIRQKQDIPHHRARPGTPDSLDDILGPAEDSEADFVEDDDGAGYALGQVNGHGKRPNGFHDGYVPPSKRRAQIWEPQIHESFQPGSTPWRGDRKYLCLNLIGLVWTIEYEQYCTITVEFYDRSFQRDFHFTDASFFTEACLTEKGILFASHPRGNQPAQVYFRPHEHWTADRPDWKVSLPDGEDISCITLGDSFVTVTTTAGYVRVYTLFGTPTRIFRQKSTPAVTSAAWRDYVMLIGNGPIAPVGGRTRLTYSILNLKRDTVCQAEDTVAITPDETIRNAFFSDTGDPCVYTSSGLLLVLLHWRTPGQAKWVPLLDTTRLARVARGKREETYWPVAVADGRFHCVILKGGDMHPYFPRPLLSEFEFEVPLASAVGPDPREKAGKVRKGKDGKETGADGEDMDEDEDAATLTHKAHEQTYVRNTILHSLHSDLVSSTHATSSQRTELGRLQLERDKALLQMVWGCCSGAIGEAERMGARALECVGLMVDATGKMVEGASKIAGRFGLRVLEGKIGEVGEQRLAGMDVDGEGDDP